MDITRRIPENLGGTENLLDDAPLVGSVELSDGIVAFGPAGLSIFVFEQIFPQSLAGAGFAVSIGLAVAGLLLLFVKPNHLTLSQWASMIIKHKRRNKDIRKNFDRSDGVKVNSDDDTRAKIGVEKIYPEHNAIEKPLGELVGLVEIDGLNLYNATQSEISNHIAQYTNFVNTQVEDDFQLYLPMRQYDPTEKVKRLEDRLNNEAKVANTPFLREYAQDRILWLSFMADKAYTREYYAIIETTESEVVSENTLEASMVANFFSNFGAFGELLGDIWLGATGGATGRMSKKEIKSRQLKEHQRKLDQFKQGFEQGTGSGTAIVSGDELGVILKEFWEGIDVRENEKENFVRRNPYVMGESDREVAKKEFEKWQQDQMEKQEAPDNTKRW